MWLRLVCEFGLGCTFQTPHQTDAVKPADRRSLSDQNDLRFDFSRTLLDVSAASVEQAEIELRRSLRRLGVAVEKADLRLDADPAPPWYRCRAKIWLQDGRKLKVTATATEISTAISSAIARVGDVSIEPKRRALTGPLAWLASLDA